MCRRRLYGSSLGAQFSVSAWSNEKRIGLKLTFLIIARASQMVSDGGGGCCCLLVKASWFGCQRVFRANTGDTGMPESNANNINNILGSI